MKIFLHCCCGPCTIGSLPQIEANGYEPFCWFYNPNIQPYQELNARRRSFIDLMEHHGMPYEASKDYPLEQWLAAVAAAPEERCAYCYKSRLSAAAHKAVEMGFSSFSTTLLISPYQDHAALSAIGEECGQEAGVEFIYFDLRPGFRTGQAAARNEELYMQKYCGCIYSEKERYVHKKK